MNLFFLIVFLCVVIMACMCVFIYVYFSFTPPLVRKSKLKKLIIADIEMYNERMCDYAKRIEKAKLDRKQERERNFCETQYNQCLGAINALNASLDFIS